MCSSCTASCLSLCEAKLRTYHEGNYSDEWRLSIASPDRYVEQFDQTMLQEMTRVVSSEGASLVEAQTNALLGDIKQLQRQMQVG